ncbi:hypothetical protein AB0M95_26780 [Sphaerisporangium sp. NPDC051017]|uniref:hypothetical protein n=1 Tax=Sphaerisporangium sp. NPDC051017 TaxID=3154636 RepID=UPI00343F4887
MDEAIAITLAWRAPTVSPLHREGWVVVRARASDGASGQAPIRSRAASSECR